MDILLMLVPDGELRRAVEPPATVRQRERRRP
jgi:hypothetical protein